MTEKRLQFMVDHLDPEDLCAGARYLLLEFHVPAGLIGYRCMTIAAQMHYTDPGKSLTKEIYPDVGRQCTPKLTGDQVERNIRYAIKAAWEYRNEDIWKEYFPKHKRPTNKEFLSRITELLRLWQSCCLEELKSK